METARRAAPFLSLILPTRQRPEGLTRFLASIAATATSLDRLEVVLVVDDDDPSSVEYVADSSMRVVRKIVSPGMTMGQLNMAGYSVSSGENVMLVNDDIVVQSPGWDEQVFDVIRQHSDGVFLVHVNDGIFEDKLCTFPLVSRQYCELAGGICPSEYRRYRIDDHIYNVFNLLSVLGKNRILYLPDVRFEHNNYVRLAGGAIEYQPDPVIHKSDTDLFNGWLDARKDLAVRLLDHVDRHRHSERARVRRDRLAPITDSVSLRKPEYVKKVAPYLRPTSRQNRVTVAVVSADMTGDHARACVAALKSYTANFDLVVVDNNRARGFNHSHEMNKLLDQCRTDYLVLLDDDVIMESGWLDSLLAAMGPKVGVVTPAHKDINGRLSYMGVVMRPDGSGHHSHDLRPSAEPVRVQTLCSAALVVDMSKCGSIRFDERYSKYFLDIDYGLCIWEAGYEVVCAPTVVTHIAGATLKQGSDKSNELFEAQRRQFVRKWMDTGRFDAIAWTRWQAVPEIATILEIPAELDALMEQPRIRRIEPFLSRAQRLFEEIRDIPTLHQWAATRLWQVVGDRRPTLSDPEGWHVACLLGFTNHPVLVEADREGFNIVLYGGEYFALPVTAGSVDVRSLSANDRHCLRARRLDVLRGVIAATVPFNVTTAGRDSLSIPEPANDLDRPRDSKRWLQRSPIRSIIPIDGFDVVALEYKFFAVPSDEAPFDYQKYIAGKYRNHIVGHSIGEVRRKISALKQTGRVLVLSNSFPPTLHRAVEDLLGHNEGTHVFVLSSLDSPALQTPHCLPIDAAVAPADAVHLLYADPSSSIVDRLKAQSFTQVMLSWDEPRALESAALERAAAAIAPSVEVVFPDGVRRTYSDEDKHRLGYNKAYLASLFNTVGLPTGKDVLEVGCSDGLVCDIMSHLGARRVIGIDVMETTGCAYPSPSIDYRSMDATKLAFPDCSFDLVYSIATFEHLPRPAKTLDEMLRVLRVGGVGYVQAGPLYYSPFGHHMFGYFGNEPWIHLRLSRRQIHGLAAKRGIDKQVLEDFDVTFEEYLDQMLSVDHINGLILGEYGLDAFKNRRDVEVLKFNVSREGDDLLTPDILRNVRNVSQEWLTEHGFEIVFRRLV